MVVCFLFHYSIICCFISIKKRKAFIYIIIVKYRLRPHQHTIFVFIFLYCPICAIQVVKDVARDRPILRRILVVLVNYKLGHIKNSSPIIISREKFVTVYGILTNGRLCSLA